MEYTFKHPIPAEHFARIKHEWTEKLKLHEGSVSDAHYQSKLEFAERIVSNIGNHGADGICAIVRNDETTAAILTIVHGKIGQPKAMLKVLDMTVDPELNLSNTEISHPVLRQLSEIAATAIIGCIELTFEAYPAQELKIYTDMPLDNAFMRGVCSEFQAHQGFNDNFEVTGHNNWMIIKRK